jgi:hypothetical protein
VRRNGERACRCGRDHDTAPSSPGLGVFEDFRLLAVLPTIGNSVGTPSARVASMHIFAITVGTDS